MIRVSSHGFCGSLQRINPDMLSEHILHIYCVCLLLAVVPHPTLPID